MSNYLLDTDFLANLDRQRNKTTYAKIILLTWEEEPVYEIQGKITQGSVNIDGTSAVRRTCSLTMVAPDVDMTNTYWALKNKFKLEVGVENTIDSRYPDVCWFKQGMFCFTSLSMSHQSNNFTITLQGKDKCCLLNGELGGMITASTDFGQLEEQEILDNGEYMYTLTDIPIKTIIRSAVHFYGGEPMENIIINDVDDYGLELLEYRVYDEDNPYMYMLRRSGTGEITNVIIDKTKEYYRDRTDTEKQKDNDYSNRRVITTVEKVPSYYDQTEIASNNDATLLYTNEYPPEDEEEKKKEDSYQLLRIGYGDTAGYRRTDLTYAGELTANVGESLTSLLDKIKSMFSSFEYFYDIDGRFIFQKKKTYQNESWNNLVTQDSDTYANDAAYDTSATIYTFENSQLLTAFSNQPNILNFKNDYSIWGKRTSASGEELPIHLRQAIEFKPRYYVSERREKRAYNDDTYYFPKRLFIADDYTITEYDKKQNTVLASFFNDDASKRPGETYYVDWREIIYQMALDYYSLDEWLDSNEYNPTKEEGKGEQISFAELLIRNNPVTCPKGRTGYEVFYTDQQGFWRQLYFPGFKYPDLITIGEMRTGARWLYKEYTKETLSNLTKAQINDVIENGLEVTTDNKTTIHYFEEYYEQDFNSDGWAKNISEAPELLNYWFDFMDTDSDFGKYAISAIGDRVKAINDDKVNSIYYKETPTVLFLTNSDRASMVFNAEDEQNGYTYINLSAQMENYFTISAQGKSAWDELQTQMYSYTNFAESVTLTAVPIYYLEPNNRILIKDDETGINGEYIITKITVPLAYNGTTSITATKAVERIY